MVHWNCMFTDQIRHEQQAAQEWQQKWGIDRDSEKKKEELLKTVIPTKIHQYLEKTNAPHTVVETTLGTKKEAFDQTLAKTLYPCTYHLVGKSVTTPGVNPKQKYKFPITTSQEVGWQADNCRNIDMQFPEGRRLKKDKLKY